MSFSKKKKTVAQQHKESLSKDSFIAIWESQGSDPNIYAYLDSFLGLFEMEFIFKYGLDDLDKCCNYFWIGISGEKGANGNERYLIQGGAIEWALGLEELEDSLTRYRLMLSLSAKGFTYEDGKIWTDDTARVKSVIKEIIKNDNRISPQDWSSVLSELLDEVKSECVIN